ncbi:hypothetical protein INT44_000194 [Umbelopsis vinacea]|uniref:Uncharacterized protein n=1 Tax=Umbelopsis vinacea TaxID=44442 RepID=A0A8H7U908_9FUNG|nr:hypothetical protein INT44_000194 [Umbelopsis vinacea]
MKDALPNMRDTLGDSANLRLSVRMDLQLARRTIDRANYSVYGNVVCNKVHRRRHKTYYRGTHYGKSMGSER